MRLRRYFRLKPAAKPLECCLASRHIHHLLRRTTVKLHRFEENINGREYVIEVSNVGDRWRAQIVRIPGGSAALMPFYGKTPDEAAQHLSRWLSIAHGQRISAP